jgi:L-ascorbate metabolism protein UlaG (beta-lactamase superfamily)
VPTTACVDLFYQDNAQVEIISPAGVRVLIDVYDPARLSAQASPKDVLLTTHTHWDHINNEFQSGFPGQQLFVQTGNLQSGDVTITGLASAHNAEDVLKDEGGTNYIYIIDLNGLRITHFGDIGQSAFTPEQLSALGQVDVAITQFDNPYSDMDAANQKGFALMEQILPHLIIPTHLNLDTATLAAQRWPGSYTTAPSTILCADGLPQTTSFLLMGDSAARFGERLNLPPITGQ